MRSPWVNTLVGLSTPLDLTTANHHGPAALSATSPVTGCPASSAQTGRSTATLGSWLRIASTSPGSSRRIARVISSSRRLPQSMSPPSSSRVRPRSQKLDWCRGHRANKAFVYAAPVRG